MSGRTPWKYLRRNIPQEVLCPECHGSGAVWRRIKASQDTWHEETCQSCARTGRDPIPFEEVVDRIADELRFERLTRLRRTVLANLVKDAVIEPASLRARVESAVTTIGEPIRP